MRYELDFAPPLAYGPDLLLGAATTVGLSVATTVFGFGLGVVCAVARSGRTGAAARVAGAYVETIRNTPLLVQLFLVFFGLPSLGIRLDATTASIIALTVNLGAYATEIVRAGLEAIPRAQIEAGVSLGLSRLQVFRYVVLMPALQVMYPALASQFILLMLATSIVSQISAPDLFHTASIIQSRTFRDFEVYIVVAALYLGLALAFRLAFAGLYQLAFARR